jgi:hypothetical protein
LLLAIAAFGCVIARNATAEDKAVLMQRLASSESSNSIDNTNLKPWHLRTIVQLFDKEGKPTDQGSIEEWWSSPTLDRRDYKLGPYTATEIRSSGTIYRTSGVDLPPYYLGLLREQLVHPISVPKDLKPRVPTFRKLSSSGVSLECIALMLPSQAPANGQNYCFAAGSDSLLVATDYGHLVITRHAAGNFQGKHVGMNTLVSYNGRKVASANIEALSTEEIAPATFDITADLREPVPHLLQAGEHFDNKTGSVVRALSHPDPEIPDSAKKGTSGGQVVLRIIIGIDGSIRRTDIVGATNELLVPPTLAAIKKWKYTPAASYGKPVEVELTTSIDFGFPD